MLGAYIDMRRSPPCATAPCLAAPTLHDIKFSSNARDLYGGFLVPRPATPRFSSPPMCGRVLGNAPLAAIPCVPSPSG